MTMNLEDKIREWEDTFFDVYGYKVSIRDKKKPLHKFGRNSAATNANEATVWSHGDSAAHETYLTSNLIDRLSSSEADTVEIGVEYHTYAAGPIFTFGVQYKTLTGLTPVALDVPCARVSRMFNRGATELAGTVYAFEDSADTDGVPDDATKVHCTIPAGFNQSFKAATTFANDTAFALSRIHVGVAKKTAATADFVMEVREPGGVFRARDLYVASSPGPTTVIEIDPWYPIPCNSDIRIVCNASASSTPVSAGFSGRLAQRVDYD